MINVTVITVGNLKESYWRDALAEYEKRLGAFCKLNVIQLKEYKLPENPSQTEIVSALSEEGKRILAAIPPRSYRIALCVEGVQFSSEELAKKKLPRKVQDRYASSLAPPSVSPLRSRQRATSVSQSPS